MAYGPSRRYVTLVLVALVVMLCTAATPLVGGITYRRRIEGSKGITMFRVLAKDNSYREQAEASESLSEFERQYPIEISTDGGKTRRYLRPENQTWYQESNETVRGSIGIGLNARVRKPMVTLNDEDSSDVIDGRSTRKFVLKISYLVESEIGSERVRLHKTRTVLLWVADMTCAPRVAAQVHHLRDGIRELDEAVEAQLASIEGLIVRKRDSLTERYEGGPPRTFVITTEVTEPECVDIDPAVFAVPKEYRHQELVLGVPGQ